jgi:hypothetical protein
MAHATSFPTSVAAVIVAALLATPQPARSAVDPTTLCHRTIVKQLAKYKKVHLKRHEKCLDQDNDGKIPGPCPDALASFKIQVANSKVAAKIALKCTMADLAALGYRSDCAYAPAVSGIEAQCVGLPVTTPRELAECMKCWKGAELKRYEATLYASHAVELCGASLDDTSPTCSPLGCTTPLPEQRDLGSGEDDCQRAIGKAGVRYLLKREKILEKCLLRGCDHPTCLAGTCSTDLALPLKLAKAESQKRALIKNKCGGNRAPSPTSTFCCRTGSANACTLVADRAECVSIGGQVQEGKTCDPGTLKCVNVPKTITWWGSCPAEGGSCPGTPLSDMDDLADCVDTTADEIVDRLLCFQFPNGNACAP